MELRVLMDAEWALMRLMDAVVAAGADAGAQAADAAKEAAVGAVRACRGAVPEAADLADAALGELCLAGRSPGPASRGRCVGEARSRAAEALGLAAHAVHARLSADGAGREGE